MHRLESGLVGLLVIAAVAAAPAAAQGPTAQESAAVASRQPADGRGTGFLRPVTAGMRAVVSARSQVETEQIALAIPNVSRSDRPSMLAAIVIDVLVAYTGKAAKNYRDIAHQLINPAIDGTNASFRLSNLDHIRLRLVHTYQTDYAEEGAHFDHVWRFADKGDGHMDEVHALRDLYRADIAILIVDDPSGCGLATRVRADADDAFAVVHHACAVANYTLAHEVGHLIGASHDLSYSSTRRWRDIMAARESCGGCPRVPVWSNPTVLINGEPAGTVELNNARVIAEQAARIAAFR